MVNSAFFQTPFFLSLTIGVPFCIFKILFGVLAVRVGSSGNYGLLQAAGFLIIIWACIDLIMNLFRAILDLYGKSNAIEFCTLAQAGRILHAPTVFLAFDTVITFSIISFVLWSGWIVHLGLIESYLWYFATTLNLISLSLVGLYNELIRYQNQKK
jgi:hypothetical protein